MTALDVLPKDLLKGKTAFVTGGGSGINLGIAKAFAATGANVAICGRTESKLEVAAAELRALGAKVSISVADVRDAAAVVAAVEKTQAELGTIDTMVCGAAGNFNAPAEMMSPNGFRTVIDIDLIGSFNAARAAFEQLKQTRGNLLFVSAGQAYTPIKFQAHAGAAKAGVENLMKNLALEWGAYGIRSNSIVPGPIADTEGLERLSQPAGKEAWLRSVPLGRFGAIEEVAAMAVVLSSPIAAYVTGSQVVVDGGFALPGWGAITQAAEDAMAAGATS
ncbi:SDR family oxidoreductase [Mycolicibacterium llatzerense]|uniref:SDR family oxidoreductase n=1 Tax=Mycolicibacterium llatzerense TaxID=280871 RepID=UPI0021B66FEA|nr:SDR family oxidoreductase [Mycolicibacterium llatzerense]MCT7366048.1 short-chain dehydrogenase [Mycolicibacterium llatzerense]